MKSAKRKAGHAPASPTGRCIELLGEVASGLAEGDAGQPKVENALTELQTHAEFIQARFQAGQHLQNLTNAIRRGHSRKAAAHVQRLQKSVQLTANDHPFEVGDKVAIIREEHGWWDGMLTGVVTQRFTSQTGHHSYSVIDEEGNARSVSQTRDMRRCA